MKTASGLSSVLRPNTCVARARLRFVVVLRLLLFLLFYTHRSPISSRAIELGPQGSAAQPSPFSSAQLTQDMCALTALWHGSERASLVPANGIVKNLSLNTLWIWQREVRFSAAGDEILHHHHHHLAKPNSMQSYAQQLIIDRAARVNLLNMCAGTAWPFLHICIWFYLADGIERQLISKRKDTARERLFGIVERRVQEEYGRS